MRHPTDLTMTDVAEGRARIVQCPDCGQMEIWTVEEALTDHGKCRVSTEPCWCEENADL